MKLPLLWVACCCAALAGCGGSTPTGPTRAPVLSRTRFLAFGDSITAGEVNSPLGLVTDGRALLPGSSRGLLVVPAASYPSQLLSLLQAKYPAQAPAVVMSNLGVPGESVLEGEVRFPGAMVVSQADAVLLMEGVAGLPIAGPDQSADVVRRMVQVAKVHGARVFVGSMVPAIEGRQRSPSPAALVAYNLKLQQMAREEGVQFVDLYNALLAEANTVIGVDGLHPTEGGYKRIADLFFAAIQANLEIK